MSIVGPLVNPNKLETRFGRFAFSIRVFRHPVLNTLLVLALALAATAVATGQLPFAR